MRKFELWIWVWLIPFLAQAQQPIIADSIQNDSLEVLRWPNYMTARLDSAIEQSAVMRYATLGMQVYDCTADSVLYSYNHTKLFTPASNEKLITGITALNRLGKNYQFKTSLYHTGRIVNDTVFVNDTIISEAETLVQQRIEMRRILKGDIYVVGAFDPAFDGYDMKSMVSQLVSLGVDSIDGTLYQDISLKDTLRWGKGWCWDDGSTNPTLSPLLIDRKDNFLQRLRSELNSCRIGVSGGDATALRPEGAILVATRTRTLEQIMNRVMKNSDNLYAEAVFYQLGALSHRKFISASELENVIDQQIRSVGFDPADYKIVDGCGLSHYNKLTPELLVAFLKYARQNPAIYNTLYECLPIAGLDGTIKDHMTDGPAYKNVRAKTGTLSGVVSLSGYCTSANGHELIFSMLFNGVRNANATRNFEDELCTILTHDEKPLKKAVVKSTRRAPVRRKAPARRKKRR